ncbi:hypothetical protein AB4F11_05430, partial [Francisella philomiragia]
MDKDHIINLCKKLNIACFGIDKDLNVIYTNEIFDDHAICIKELRNNISLELLLSNKKQYIESFYEEDNCIKVTLIDSVNDILFLRLDIIDLNTVNQNEGSLIKSIMNDLPVSIFIKDADGRY